MPSYLLCLLVFLTTHATSATISLMQYNVENLYDTEHDAGTDDYTYLPLKTKRALGDHYHHCQGLGSRSRIERCLNLDWSESLVKQKIKNLSKVINSFSPSILVLNEVENMKVLKQLADEGLNQEYSHLVLIPGDDTRGIDNALISKYPVLWSRHHSIFHQGKKLDTRGILEVALKVQDKTIVIFANHWPSQSNPTTERIAAAQTLQELAENVTADMVLAMGDFNVHDTDTPYPYLSMPDFIDIELLARANNFPLWPGTHFDDGHWNSRDKIFWHKSSRLSVNAQNYSIFAAPFLFERNEKEELIPMTFDPKSGQGYSDHLPTTLTISL